MAENLRTKRLIDEAAGHCGTDQDLARVMNTSRQVISDWRHGRKKPSAMVLADLAVIAGYDPGKVVVGALAEEAQGDRKARLQYALRRMHEATAAKLTAAMAKFYKRHHRPARLTPQT